MEPIQAVSLDDLDTGPVQVTVTRGDGRMVSVPMRPLTEGEIRAIRRAVKWPEPPIKDMTKSGPIYDRGNPDYLRAIEDANRELTLSIMVACLQVPIPGDTAEAKCRALSEKIGQRVFVQLVEAMGQLNGIGQEELAAVARSFLAGRDHGAPGNGAAGDDATNVARSAKSRAGRDPGL